MKPQIAISPDARRFGDLVQQGIESWVEAGKLLVLRTNDDPTFPHQVEQACPAITREMIAAFRRIGQGLVLPTLMLSDSRPGVKALLSRPIQEQKEYDARPIPIVVRLADKKGSSPQWETVEIQVRELTKPQTLQVFGTDGLRSEAAQKTYLLAKERGLNKEPWTIVGDRVVFTKTCSLTARELQNLLKKLAQE